MPITNLLNGSDSSTNHHYYCNVYGWEELNVVLVVNTDLRAVFAFEPSQITCIDNTVVRFTSATCDIKIQTAATKQLTDWLNAGKAESSCEVKNSQRIEELTRDLEQASEQHRLAAKEVLRLGEANSQAKITIENLKLTINRQNQPSNNKEKRLATLLQVTEANCKLLYGQKTAAEDNSKRLTASLVSAQANLQKTKGHADKLRVDLTASEQHVKKLKLQAETLQSNESNHQKRLKEAQAQIEKLQQSNKNLSSSVAYHQNALSDAQARSKALQLRIEDSSSPKNGSPKEAERLLVASRHNETQLQQSLDSAHNYRRNLERQLSTSLTNEQLLRTSVAELQAKIDELQTQLSSPCAYQHKYEESFVVLSPIDAVSLEASRCGENGYNDGTFGNSCNTEVSVDDSRTAKLLKASLAASVANEQRLEELLATSQANNQIFEASLSLATTKIHHLEQSLTSESTKVEQLSQSLASSRARHEELVGDANKKASQQESASREREKKLAESESKVVQLEGLLSASIKREKQLDESLSKALSAVKDYENALTASRANEKQLEAKLVSVQFKVQQTEAASLLSEKKAGEALANFRNNEKRFLSELSVYQKGEETLKQQVAELSESLESSRKKLEELERDHRTSQTQVFALSAMQAKFNGMFNVGDPLVTCSNNFKELIDNSLTNLVFDISTEDSVLEIICPIITNFAFHSFWSAVLGEEEPKHDAKVQLAKKLSSNEQEIVNCANVVTNATTRAITAASVDIDCAARLLQFFQECARWHVDMMACDPPLELLPKGRIPKKGTPLSQVKGQIFELDFGGGFPVVDCLEAPGLMVRDLNGTVFQKAKFKCSLKK